MWVLETKCDKIVLISLKTNVGFTVATSVEDFAGVVLELDPPSMSFAGAVSRRFNGFALLPAAAATFACTAPFARRRRCASSTEEAVGLSCSA